MNRQGNNGICFCNWGHYEEAMAFESTWSFLPHSPIEKLESNLWRVEAAIPRNPIKRVMTVVRREDGGLVIHSAIALDDRSMTELEQFGTPAYLVVPNAFHRIDALRYKTRYPALRVVAPRGSAKKVSDCVKVDLAYNEYTGDNALTMQHARGTKEREGVLTVRSSGGTSLVFNDIVFNMPHVGGFGGWVLKNVTQSSGGPKCSRIARMFLIDNKDEMAAHFEALAKEPQLKRAIVSHHETILDPADALVSLASSLRT